MRACPIDRAATRTRDARAVRVPGRLIGIVPGGAGVLSGRGASSRRGGRATAAPAPPPQVPEDRRRRRSGVHQTAGRPTTDFHERRRTASGFRSISTSAGSSRLKETSMRPCSEYQDALTVVETKRRGPFQPADAALAHRRMAGASIGWDGSPRPKLHYKKALKLSPKDPKVWNDAGYSYYLQGRWADAERALETAVKLAPDDERIRTNLGLTLAAAGETQEALPLLSQSNGDAIGHANLGYLLAATGNSTWPASNTRPPWRCGPTWTWPAAPWSSSIAQAGGEDHAGAGPERSWLPRTTFDGRLPSILM